jgi:hypothetical protein
MPRRRHRPAPAPDGTWERCAESVLCHEDDCFPGALCLFPLAISLIFALVFSLDRNIEGVGPTKAIFAVLGAIGVALISAFLLGRLPACRRAGGCVRVAEESAIALRAALFARPGPAPSPPSRTTEAPEFAVPGGGAVTAVVENPLPAVPTSAGGESA